MKKTIIILTIGIIILLLCIISSIVFGSKLISIENVYNAIFNSKISNYEVNVVLSRLPRTFFGLLAGAALAFSGSLMQAITKNPIADPSILGVNTGAALSVVIGITFFNIQTKVQYIWLAFFGAMITAIVVYGIASIGRDGATPIKLALAGAAMTTSLLSLINITILPNIDAMNKFRFWQVGSIGGASWDDILIILPYLIFAFILGLITIPSLNTLALGDEIATSLGLNVNRTRLLSSFSAVLLCSTITAIAGPISFIGLMVPHLMRAIFGPDLKKIIPFSILGGSCLLLLSDVLGRLIGWPRELETGIVTAMIGAPIFIIIIRKVKISSL